MALVWLANNILKGEGTSIGAYFGTVIAMLLKKAR